MEFDTLKGDGGRPRGMEFDTLKGEGGRPRGMEFDTLKGDGGRPRGMEFDRPTRNGLCPAGSHGCLTGQLAWEKSQYIACTGALRFFTMAS